MDMFNFDFTVEFINQNTINSNRVYGEAIFKREAITIIDDETDRIEAWVGGLDGKMTEGGGNKRRVEFELDKSGLKWKCTGNPKNHQIFCKHCVALALYISQITNKSKNFNHKSMQKLQFTVEIQATKEKVWATLWEDKTFRDWANIIDEGTYMTGVLKQGGEIQFISAVNGYGVTSYIEKLVEGEFLLLKHEADTQDSGQKDRAKEWTGGEESYALKEIDGITILTAAFDVPPQMLEYFQTTYPKALERVKALAETA